MIALTVEWRPLEVSTLSYSPKTVRNSNGYSRVISPRSSAPVLLEAAQHLLKSRRLDPALPGEGVLERAASEVYAADDERQGGDLQRVRPVVLEPEKVSEAHCHHPAAEDDDLQDARKSLGDLEQPQPPGVRHLVYPREPLVVEHPPRVHLPQAEPGLLQ
jgi:hypothetical protein